MKRAFQAALAKHGLTQESWAKSQWMKDHAGRTYTRDHLKKFLNPSRNEKRKSTPMYSLVAEFIRDDNKERLAEAIMGPASAGTLVMAHEAAHHILERTGRKRG
jgi:hypothetical protein